LLLSLRFRRPPTPVGAGEQVAGPDPAWVCPPGVGVASAGTVITFIVRSITATVAIAQFCFGRLRLWACLGSTTGCADGAVANLWPGYDASAAMVCRPNPIDRRLGRRTTARGARLRRMSGKPTPVTCFLHPSRNFRSLCGRLILVRGQLLLHLAAFWCVESLLDFFAWSERCARLVWCARASTEVRGSRRRGDVPLAKQPFTTTPAFRSSRRPRTWR
jgi:hypothetical protein